jgi:hypothetical protein
LARVRARAVGQSACELFEPIQVKLAGHRLGTASLRRIAILPRKPFKAVARVQIPLGHPAKTRSEAFLKLTRLNRPGQTSGGRLCCYLAAS